MIVDDDTNITELLSVNLKSEGYSVAVESSAANVDRGTQGETRLVIVDAMKQEYSGLDLVYDFRDDPRTEHIGIILYSPFKSERMVIDALSVSPHIFRHDRRKHTFVSGTNRRPDKPVG